jgi:hypothetical protein
VVLVYGQHSCPTDPHLCDGRLQIDYEEFRRFVVLLPANQLSQGGIVSSWIDSADWMSGIEYRQAHSQHPVDAFVSAAHGRVAPGMGARMPRGVLSVGPARTAKKCALCAG